MLRFADTVVAVSPPLCTLFRELRGKNRQTKLIFNAVDPLGLLGEVGGETLRKRLLKREVGLLVGCFGRLSHEKGQDILLRAIPSVIETFPTASFLLLGDGPAKKALVELATELGIRERVLFQPHASAMRDYYEAIDLLVLPSRSEGLPNVILEALSFGVEVVATDVGAVGEVIRGRTSSWLVPSGDVTALAAGIMEGLSERARQDTETAVGGGGLDEKFTPEYRGQQIVALYKDVLRQQR